MTSIRVDTSSLIPGAVVVSNSAGFGVLAQDVPASGANGPGIAYSSLSFPADTGKEVRIALTSWPTSGTLIIYEDTSFEYDGPSFSTTYQLYLDGVAVGSPQAFSVDLPNTAVEVTPGKASIQFRQYAPVVTVGGSVVLTPVVAHITIKGYAPAVAQPVAQQPTGNCQLYVKLGGVYQLLRLN